MDHTYSHDEIYRHPLEPVPKNILDLDRLVIENPFSTTQRWLKKKNLYDMQNSSDLRNRVTLNEWRPDINYGDTNIVELCHSCGWNSWYQQKGYKSRLKVFHVSRMAGYWALGKQWVLRDQPNDNSLGNDYMTQEFLRNQPNMPIPLVKEMRLLSDPDDPVCLTLMSRAPGKPLIEVWRTLSRDQRLSYARQLGDAIRYLRQFTAPTPQKVNGDVLDDLTFRCGLPHPPVCKQLTATDDGEWFDSMVPEFRRGIARRNKTFDPKIIEEKLKEFKDDFPQSAPYVLTHGDLNLGNVIVKDGQIEAIIDWELAGYHPWWVEYMGMRYCFPNDSHDDPDKEIFKTVWRHAHPEMDDAYTFYHEFFNTKLSSIQWIFENCGAKHTETDRVGQVPKFCECKPYQAVLEKREFGEPSGHYLPDPDPYKVRVEYWNDPEHQADLRKLMDAIAANEAALAG